MPPLPPVVLNDIKSFHALYEQFNFILGHDQIQKIKIGWHKWADHIVSIYPYDTLKHLLVR